MSHAIIDVTVVVRLKAYPSFTEEGDSERTWEKVKEDACADLVGKRVVDGKPTFWEWFTGWYDYEPEVLRVVSKKVIEEIFDGE